MHVMESRNKTRSQQCFQISWLKITIEANKETANFLDVTLDLVSGSYKPYMKPNKKLMYVHQQIIVPPHCKRTSQTLMFKLISNISSSKEMFNESILRYQKALEESEYDFKLIFNPG